MQSTRSYRHREKHRIHQLHLEAGIRIRHRFRRLEGCEDEILGCEEDLVHQHRIRREHQRIRQQHQRIHRHQDQVHR